MNSFGRVFRIHLFGESHGKAIGVCVDGCPPGVPLAEKDFIHDLSRRRPGARGTTPRKEKDSPEILAGVFNGHTTGAPITITFANENIRPKDYSFVVDQPRPGHADMAAAHRFRGFQDYRGGGHFSGRMTLALVAAGVVAKKLLGDIRISAALVEAGGQRDIDKAVENAMREGDSIGGIVECTAENIPMGWGEPFFDSVESVISHLVFAIPAIKGIGFGSGFRSATMKGSGHNDPILDKSGKTKTNHAGGITGGLTNGNLLEFRVAVKPTSSIAREQRSLHTKTNKVEAMKVAGRHDACIALRVPVVVEAVTAIALADFQMLYR